MSTPSHAALADALAAVIREARAVDPADDTAALVFVTGLRKAFEELPELFGLAGTLAEAAMLGSTARRSLADRLAELDRVRAELAEDQQTLQRLRPVLSELKAAAAERERTAGELAELQRLRALSEDLPALREQRLLLERRRADLDEAVKEEAGLAEAATGLVRLAEDRLALLTPLIRAAMERAAHADAELSAAGARLREEQVRLKALTAELQKLTADFEALREESEKRVPYLTRYRQADGELRDALARSPLAKGNGLGHAREVLAEIEQRLRDVDGLLRAALRTHDEFYAALRQETGLV